MQRGNKIKNFFLKNKYIILILLVSLFLNLFEITSGLPYLWHPNEFVRFTLRMGKNFDFNPHWFINPSLPIYLTGIALIPYYLYLVTFNPGLINELISFDMTYDSLYQVPAEFVTITFTIARLLVVVFAVLTVFLTYLIGKKYFGKKVGILSSLFLALSPGFVNLAHYATVDIYVIFFSTLCLFSCLEIIKTKKWRYYILAGVSAGFAAASKYTGGLVAIFIVLAHFFSINKFKIKNFFDKKLIISGMIVIFSFLIAVPFCILTFDEFSRDLIDDIITREQWGWRPMVYRAWFTNMHYLAKLTGGPLLLLSIFAFFYLFYKNITDKNKFSLFLWLYVFSYYMIVGTWFYTTTRFIAPLTPFIFILSSIFIFEFLKKKRYTNFVKVFVILSILVLFVNTLIQLYGYTNDPRYKVGGWIEKNIDPEESIVLFTQQRVIWPQIPRNYNFKYDSRLHLNNLSDREFDEFVSEIKEDGPDYIILVRELSIIDISPWPKKTIFIRNLMGGNLNYEIVARFDKHGPILGKYKYLTKHVILKRQE
ncbi:phospholipid carrier-dependent glycosyltransferase [Candidatus Woesearchaeota archaeon]|nr:phospholipid carrier-dependent glycosyltransferase [Candidatus Woesearchaeota archaeon]